MTSNPDKELYWTVLTYLKQPSYSELNTKFHAFLVNWFRSMKKLTLSRKLLDQLARIMTVRMKLRNENTPPGATMRVIGLGD